MAPAPAAAEATRFLDRYASTPARRRSRVPASAPLPARHAAALHDPAVVVTAPPAAGVDGSSGPVAVRFGRRS